MTNRPLRDASVLVTGADGFIGSHLVERLVAEEANVRAFCLYNSQGSWGWLDDASPTIRDRVEVCLGDIRDARLVDTACDGMDIIFHLAALIAIPYSYRAADSYVHTNVLGTLNVLEAARRHSPQRLVHTSTSEVYGTPASLPIRETHPLNAQSPYAASKIAADQLALAFQRSHGTPVTILRPFNTYGPRQSTRAVIPTILTQLLCGRREIELGRLDPRRDLTFVDDTVDAFVRAATAPGVVGDVIQLGTGQAHSVGEVLESAAKMLGVQATPVVRAERLRPDSSEVAVLQSDPARARDRLAWVPKVQLEDGLARTAQWLRSHLDRYRPDYHHV